MGIKTIEYKDILTRIKVLRDRSFVEEQEEGGGLRFDHSILF